MHFTSILATSALLAASQAQIMGTGAMTTALSTGTPGGMGINGTTGGSNTTVITSSGANGPTTITSTRPAATDSDSDSSSNNNSGGSGSGSSGGSSGGSSSGNDNDSDGSDAAASQSDNAAPIATGGALAGLGVFAVAAVGML